MLKHSLFALTLLCGTFAMAAPATQPAIDGTDPRVAIRADAAFGKGDYATALPLLQAMASASKNDPTRLGAVQEKVRVAQKALDSLKNAPAAAQQPAEVPMDPETRKKHVTPKPGEVLSMSIKELGNFQYDDQKGGLPADVKSLDGATVKIQGFMIPMDQADRITQFALVPSLFSCCYGQPPQIQHTIVVNCPKGKAVSYCPDEISVQGRLTVQEKKDDGYVVSLFEIGADSVKVAGK
jgi:hypothetical protein